MSEQNLFEIASRKKLRFESPKGFLEVEQLWDLPLTSEKGVSLDSLAITANRSLREQGEESFVDSKPSAVQAKLRLQLEILKHIIAVRQEENAASRKAVENRQEAERLRELLAQRSDKALEQLSDADLQKRLDELEGKS